MAKIYTSRADEDTIAMVQRGARAKGPKWTVLRIALALSLKQDLKPSESFDTCDIKGSEYTLELLTGKTQDESDGFVDSFRALLSVYHQCDLFNDIEDKEYSKLLQRHVRRGLKEIQSSWRESHDFHEFLFQEFFAGLNDAYIDTSRNETSVIEALSELGMSADIIETRNGPRVTRYLARLADADDYGKLDRRLEDLAFTLGLKDVGVFLSPAGEPKTVFLDVPRLPQYWDTVSASLLNSFDSNSSKLPVLLGVDVEGSPIVFNLVDAPHLLIAGTTGSGKSVCLHSLILSLLVHQTDEQVRLVLIDPKRVEFSSYKGLSWLFTPIITEGVDAVKSLKALVREMEVREKDLATNGVRELSELGNSAPPRIVVVVEELADLFAQAPEAEESLVRLAQKARATGIHLVLATQRPDAATFSGLLRANIPSRVALTVQKSSDSRIILDEVGAEKLVGKGDALVKWLGSKVIRVHGVNLSLEDISYFVKQLGSKG